jgi:hypothetical protein
MRKDNGERHHPAGRRKTSFLFTYILHSHCHLAVHSEPGKATLLGLLWSGRNSKVFTEQDARKLVAMCPHPPQYALEIFSHD